VALGIAPFSALSRSVVYTALVVASEPVTRIMSVPAFAALRAMEPLDRPRAFAVPSRESVIETPVKPRLSRKSVVAMAADQPAALAASYAEYVAFDNMISGMPWPIDVR